MINLFFFRFEFWPYSVIRLEDFELLWFLFLNLKCFIKIEFVVLFIACFQCDCKCIGSSAQWMVKEVQISLSVGLKARTFVSSNYKCLVSSLVECERYFFEGCSQKEIWVLRAPLFWVIVWSPHLLSIKKNKKK